MHVITSNARGLRVLFALQSDLLLFLTAVCAALLAGAWLQTLGLN